MINPIPIYVKNDREREFYTELLDALADQLEKPSRSQAALAAILEQAEEQTHLIGGGKIAAILAKYEVK